MNDCYRPIRDVLDYLEAIELALKIRGAREGANKTAILNAAWPSNGARNHFRRLRNRERVRTDTHLTYKRALACSGETEAHLDRLFEQHNLSCENERLFAKSKASKEAFLLELINEGQRRRLRRPVPHLRTLLSCDETLRDAVVDIDQHRNAGRRHGAFVAAEILGQFLADTGHGGSDTSLKRRELVASMAFQIMERAAQAMEDFTRTHELRSRLSRLAGDPWHEGNMVITRARINALAAKQSTQPLDGGRFWGSPETLREMGLAEQMLVAADGANDSFRHWFGFGTCQTVAQYILAQIRHLLGQDAQESLNYLREVTDRNLNRQNGEEWALFDIEAAMHIGVKSKQYDGAIDLGRQHLLTWDRMASPPPARRKLRARLLSRAHRGRAALRAGAGRIEDLLLAERYDFDEDIA